MCRLVLVAELLVCSSLFADVSEILQTTNLINPRLESIIRICLNGDSVSTGRRNTDALTLELSDIESKTAELKTRVQAIIAADPSLTARDGFAELYFSTIARLAFAQMLLQKFKMDDFHAATDLEVPLQAWLNLSPLSEDIPTHYGENYVVNISDSATLSISSKLLRPLGIRSIAPIADPERLPLVVRSLALAKLHDDLEILDVWTGVSEHPILNSALLEAAFAEGVVEKKQSILSESLYRTIEKQISLGDFGLPKLSNTIRQNEKKNLFRTLKVILWQQGLASLDQITPDRLSEIYSKALLLAVAPAVNQLPDDTSRTEEELVATSMALAENSREWGEAWLGRARNFPITHTDRFRAFVNTLTHEYADMPDGHSPTLDVAVSPRHFALAEVFKTVLGPSWQLDRPIPLMSLNLLAPAVLEALNRQRQSNLDGIKTITRKGDSGTLPAILVGSPPIDLQIRSQFPGFAQSYRELPENASSPYQTLRHTALAFSAPWVGLAFQYFGVNFAAAVLPTNSVLTALYSFTQTTMDYAATYNATAYRLFNALFWSDFVYSFHLGAEVDRGSNLRLASIEDPLVTPQTQKLMSQALLDINSAGFYELFPIFAFDLAPQIGPLYEFINTGIASQRYLGLFQNIGVAPSRVSWDEAFIKSNARSRMGAIRRRKGLPQSEIIRRSDLVEQSKKELLKILGREKQKASDLMARYAPEFEALRIPRELRKFDPKMLKGQLEHLWALTESGHMSPDQYQKAQIAYERLTELIVNRWMPQAAILRNLKRQNPRAVAGSVKFTTKVPDVFYPRMSLLRQIYKFEQLTPELLEEFKPPGEDLYAILGVGHNASDFEIRKRFRDLARQLHPDIAGTEVSNSEEFRKYSDAYEVLKNPLRRRNYDKMLADWSRR